MSKIEEFSHNAALFKLVVKTTLFRVWSILHNHVQEIIKAKFDSTDNGIISLGIIYYLICIKLIQER